MTGATNYETKDSAEMDEETHENELQRLEDEFDERIRRDP